MRPWWHRFIFWKQLSYPVAPYAEKSEYEMVKGLVNFHGKLYCFTEGGVYEVDTSKVKKLKS